jgi:replicative DNA helicase
MATVAQNLEAERRLLAGLFAIRNSLWDVRTIVRADDFSKVQHKAMFEAIERLTERRMTVDVVTVSDELEKLGELKSFENGTMGVAEIATLLPEGSPAVYAGIVREQSKLRRLAQLAAGIAARVEQRESADEIMGQAIAEMLTTETRSGLVTIGELVPEMLVEFERRATVEDSSALAGVKFGVSKLDWVLGGLLPGEQCVVAADVGGGKTALSAQAALNLCLRDEGSAIVFSLEMTRKQLTERAFAFLAKVNSRLLRTGHIRTGNGIERLTSEHFAALHEAAVKLVNAKLYLEDKTFRMRELVAKARAWRARTAGEGKKGLIVVDYAQQVRAEIARGENRAHAVGQIAYGCKELAKELDVPLILLSQLNRSPAQSGDPPTKFNLKESGDIEASADQIVLLYNPDKTADGRIFAIVDKNRQGESKTVAMHFMAKHFAFFGTEED